MKMPIDFFGSMTAGRTFGRRIFTRYGIIKIDTYHRFYQGFAPHYTTLAKESLDPNFQQKSYPPFPLKLTGTLDVIRAKSDSYPTVMLPNESSTLDKVIYSTDLWRFFVDDTNETDLGVPNGTPATNVGIDAVIFNSKILTSHPLDSSLWYGAINATPGWASTGSLSAVTHILHVIEDRCLVLDASLGAGKPRDRVKIVASDFSVSDGFSIGSNDYDIMDIADYQARYALLFAQKTTSGSSSPRLSQNTTVFLWNVVAGNSYDLKLTLPGLYQCSTTKNGVVYAFTNIGPALACFEFTGSSFREVGRMPGITISSSLNVPKTRISVEGDFFVLLATSAAAPTQPPAPFYWIPGSNEAFFLLSAIAETNVRPFKSVLIAQDPATGTNSRYLSYQTEDGIGTLYSATLEGNIGISLVADRYDKANKSGNFALPGAADDASRVAQSFTAKGGTLSKASFYLAKEGTPTGTMVAKVYAHSGTFGTSSVPTGSALASSDAIDISTLSASYATTSFSFSGANQIALTAGTNYCISFEYVGGTTSNRPDVAFDATSPTHPGNSAIYAFGAWTAVAGTDLIFEVIEILPATASYKSNQIPAPGEKGFGGPMSRMQIMHVEVLYVEPPQSTGDSITLSLTTKDEYESETYTTQTAIIKSTTAASTNATVSAKRAILPIGANATEFELAVSVVATAPWNASIRSLIIVYEPIALQI